MTLVPNTNNDGLVAPTTNVSGANDVAAGLAEWAAAMDSAYQLGKALCQTAFAPKDFTGKPEAAAAAILAGYSLGLSPMNALSNIFVVHGRPALYARTMVALVIGHGHEIERTDASNDSVTISARRKGAERWQEFTWTIERAKQAGYTSNAKYQTDPIAMLTAKAQAEACRTIAPDVLAGMPYSAEEVELEDMGEQGPISSAPAHAAPAKRTTRLTRKTKTPAAPKPLPATPEEAEAEARAEVKTPEVVDQSTGEMFDMDPEDSQHVWDEELASLAGDAPGLREFYSRASKAGMSEAFLKQIVDAGAAAAQ